MTLESRSGTSFSVYRTGGPKQASPGRKGGEMAMQCRLCNEAFEQVDLDFGEVIQIEDEYWHAECYAEYFDEALETA